MERNRWEIAKSEEYDPSVDLALGKLTGPPKKVAMNLIAKIENLQTVSLEELPKRDEDHILDIDEKKLKFFAIDYRARVRIYIVPVAPVLLFFSHAVFKKDQKLDPQDTRRVQANYQKYQREKLKDQHK